ncbi:MAG: V-type ATP synthase subunit A [Nitrospirae bacterium]|nr:V-type ATP synthase subunit A [Nitrospirota bacterium]
MIKTAGIVSGINGSMITVEFSGSVRQNEVAYVLHEDMRLKAEVVRIKGRRADLQVFESTRGLKSGAEVEFSGGLLSVELGPGLLGQLFDGLQNPLDRLAARHGFFLKRGEYITPLQEDKTWSFVPTAKAGDRVSGGDTIGTVIEGRFIHKIVVPFYLTLLHDVIHVIEPGDYTIKEKVALLKDNSGQPIPVTMSFMWPVKRPVTLYEERLPPVEQLVTRIRIIDTLFPVSKGGTYCVPGPFGAGKTVLQQLTAKSAEVDIVIVAACGERAGEVVETIREFPMIIDPSTAEPLINRTIIVCNTSSMPVAARESSVYTAITMAEYYRHMGLHVLLLADSTSRWAQAMRERSGRLEEIPGEEAFPAYLQSVIADFYERSGLVRLKDGGKGSVTIGGAVSPAGGNFEEPVTQATLKTVGAFHALSRERSDARRYPAIDPLESWSKYKGAISPAQRSQLFKLLKRADEIGQMMKVVGEEGTSLDDFMLYLKAELFDEVYLQQNAYDEVDGATSIGRQAHVFSIIFDILNTHMEFKGKDEARRFFNEMRQHFLDYNTIPEGAVAFDEKEENIMTLLLEHVPVSDRSCVRTLSEALVESDLDSFFRRSKMAGGIDKKDLSIVIKDGKSDEKNI